MAIYRQLSVRVKFKRTLYAPLPAASAPLATCCAVVDRDNAGRQDPVPPVPVTVAEAQATRTAETGTVAHDGKVVDAVATCSVQVELLEPLDACQVTFAAADPITIPESGSVALKLIVAGVVLTLLIFTLACGAAAAILGFDADCALADAPGQSTEIPMQQMRASVIAR